jgi:hypothetical protein
MDTVAVVVAILGCALLVGGCRKHTPASTENKRVEIHVQITPQDRPAFERILFVDDPNAVAALDSELGDWTGTMIATYKVPFPGREMSMEWQMKVPIAHGKFDGAAQNFCRLEGQWRLMNECVYRNGTQHGPFVAYHPDTGKKAGEGFLKDGKRDGEIVWYYPDGQVLARTRYTDGEFDGRCEVYQKTGEVLADGVYANGMMLSGTFVENLNVYLRETLSRSPVELRIVTGESANQSSKPSALPSAP